MAAVLLVRLVVVTHRAHPVPLRMAAPAGSGTGLPQALPSSSVLPTAPATEPAGVPPAGGVTAPVAVIAGGATVVVHVVGQVRHAGVVRLPTGARVEQALAAAGGATAKADLVRVNLARPVVDGEQIVVPKPGEPIVGADGAPSAGGEPAGPAGPAGSPHTLIDLNTATVAQLDELPGIGPVLAQRILDWRAQNGRFSTVDELGEVSGIGEKVLARLRPLVRV